MMPNSDVARAPDVAVIYVVTFVYLIALVVTLPSAELPRAAGSMTVLAATLHVVGCRMRGKPMTAIGTLAVAFLGCAILIFPTFGAFGGAGGVASAMGLVGSQVCLLVWCAARWVGSDSSGEGISFRRALTFAAIGAATLSVVATVPIIGALMREDGVQLLAVYPAYFVGAVGAAVVYWALQRFRHLATGRYAIGLLAGMCCYGAVAPVVFLMKSEPFDPATALGTAFIAGGLVGPALMFDSGLSDAM